MPDVFKVADILVSHAVKAHKNDIAIIAYYGSYASGHASPTSDLDMFYIPDEGKARTLCTQFVLDGLPYDFWPVSWAFAEKIANAKHSFGVAAAIIADAHVLYHRSPEDLDRFNALKARIAELTGPEGRKAMVMQALEEYKTTLFQLGQMRLAADEKDAIGLGWASRGFIASALNSLALVNQTYFTRGWGANFGQLERLAVRPEGLEQQIRAIVGPWGEAQDAARSGGESAAGGVPWVMDYDSRKASGVTRGEVPALDRFATVLSSADGLAKAVRRILLSAQASVGRRLEPREAFEDFYFFVFEYMNKVLSACGRGDAYAAGYAAFQLHEEISNNLNRVERGFAPSDFNLLGEYSHAYAKAGFADLTEAVSSGDLPRLAGLVRELEERMRTWMEERGVPTSILSDEDELRRFLQRRDPVVG